MTDLTVLFDEVPAPGGARLGFARLNAERSLNALSLDMIRLLDRQLRRWAQDRGIACVVLHGAGEKAFCAGGDIRSLYQGIKDRPPHADDSLPNPTALQFFTDEYRLDHLLHRYPKPLLVWGSGITLGGGVGLMVGASHRVVTETSRVGMPEITIGLFPDVGASWFLGRMPGRIGLFLALTGAQINGSDALVAGLADHFLRSSDRDAVFSQLTSVEWQQDAQRDRALLSDLLAEFSAAATPLRPASNLLHHRALIESLCSGDLLIDIVARIVAYAGEDAWLKRCANTLAAGSPTTAALGWELQRRARSLDLADVFRLELIVALQCCAHPNLSEGIRALLIDKDNSPRWTPPTLAEVTQSWVDEHFLPLRWPEQANPLAGLDS